ncbi:cysteine desulfurase SufS [Spirochaetota bacterium]|nr:cysteine desulfurase SufS [Spirochaetota bacterium]
MNTMKSHTVIDKPPLTFITDDVKRCITDHQISDLFPAIKENSTEKQPLSYLDSAAATLKPTPVINALTHYYTKLGVNTYRGVYNLSEQATELFDRTRQKVQAFINAEHKEEIIFTYGTTDSFNLLAETYGRYLLNEGEEIIISEMEHHANILPWQKIAEDKNLIIKVVRVNDDGELDLEHFMDLLTPEVKIVSITHTSNVLGTINPVETIIKKAHQNGSVVALDCAQTMIHEKIDVTDLDVDFIAFSSNKMFGPTGAGVLYGKKKYLDQMPPYRRGGGGILNVTFEKAIFQGAPYKFEVGTQPIGSVIALGTAIDLIEAIGSETFIQHEKQLMKSAKLALGTLPYVQVLGNAAQRASVFSFLIENTHPHDIGTLLNEENVAIRVGHHCAQPIINKYDANATARASFAIYNSIQDVERLIAAIKKVYKLLSSSS